MRIVDRLKSLFSMMRKRCEVCGKEAYIAWSKSDGTTMYLCWTHFEEYCNE